MRIAEKAKIIRKKSQENWKREREREKLKDFQFQLIWFFHSVAVQHSERLVGEFN